MNREPFIQDASLERRGYGVELEEIDLCAGGFDEAPLQRGQSCATNPSHGDVDVAVLTKASPSEAANEPSFGSLRQGFAQYAEHSLPDCVSVAFASGAGGRRAALEDREWPTHLA
jgi:hypothetical protein